MGNTSREIRERMIRRLPGDIRMLATSTIHAVLDRHGLVQRMRPRRRATGTPLSQGAETNALWCADFKGEFKLGNGRYCYPRLRSYYRPSVRWTQSVRTGCSRAASGGAVLPGSWESADYVSLPHRLAAQETSPSVLR